MTDITTDSTILITTHSDAIKLFHETSGNDAVYMGLEYEMPIMSINGSADIPTAETILFVQNELVNQGLSITLEASGVLEYGSGITRPNNGIDKLANQIFDDIAVIDKILEQENLRKLPYSFVPTSTCEMALAKKVPSKRLDACLEIIPHIFSLEALAVPLLISSIHVSLSPRDADEQYKMMQRSYMLTPLILASMNSSPGYSDNNPHFKNFHQRGSIYETHFKKSGVANSFIQSLNGDEFVERHVQDVFENTMYFAYDHNGSIKQPNDLSKPFTFADLTKEGLGTASNFKLAASFLYYDVKVANLSDPDKIGQRIELRMADSGNHQPHSMLLLTSALIPDETCGADFDKLLVDFGFMRNHNDDIKLLEKSRYDAVYHNGSFMDIYFGTGKMRDFSRCVADIVTSHHKNMHGLAPYLDKLEEILLTGQCDAKTYAQSFKSIGDTMRI